MNEPASEVYELVLEETGGPKRLFRGLSVVVLNLLSAFTQGEGPQNPGGMIISVVERQTGKELFRHVEDLGDDEGHLLAGIKHDLETMTALEFEARWTT